MKKYSGFTLMELMITLFIVGILLTVGVPSMKSFLQSNQLIASTNELISAFHVARSEAIKLNSRVTICESSNGKTCATTGSWREGWIVFVDANGDLANTGAPCAAVNTDCLLRIHDEIDNPDFSLTGVDANSAAVSSITFTSRGLPRSTVGDSESATFSVCSYDSSNNVLGSRAVVLGFSGRVRVSDNAAIISCPATP
jgi:type IV fimbrial biogenesis protein FimT